MKYIILGSLVILNIMNPPPIEKSLKNPIEFKNEAAQIIPSNEMVFPFEITKAKQKVKDRSKKIDFFSYWKGKLQKTSNSSTSP